ncbi:MAG: carboxy-S-adenosyl-L-methionine synthase CmoA [Aliiglaciecola sp.]|uniref:carboxy-S-adenosyl-L-methionine synthase CmoA n=1 Tax=Aliiglaciecola sp. M165 TaxID=2593649 RepID=UPI00117DBF51|nr:carboxy-S-adenosyl-L-methionine synthase CmoA [Aliiglaciecola sp. M165]TRY30195.1 carboxy-S-adenosyl-L-methionine synthase CmoA [Aliiglaciecola sp. M165]
MSKKDAIYSVPKSTIGDFSFDEAVVDVFPDMIKRSVPGYSTIIDNIGLIAQKYALPNTNLYDLGCSLGEASIVMRRKVSQDGCKIIAVDNSPAMIEKCERHLHAFRSNVPVEAVCSDITKISLENASVVVLNFTLQFIEPELRRALIESIYAALKPGGVLVLSEKIRHPNQVGDELLVTLHHEFKRNNGYSELEISQKRSALENVMRIDTLEQHDARLKQAGFTDIVPWFSCFNFSSIVAVK